MGESRGQAGLGLFVLCGLRAVGLVANYWRSKSHHRHEAFSGLRERFIN
ncbi:MAG: hypothetical protein JKY29_01555 [Gammaproteobacteria bacterium]|nr:hypothetical protein [Gammaproteobacteria bacterium]